MTVRAPTYDVTVIREGNWWLADVRGVPGAHTHAKTLAGLARCVREVIALMEDLPADTLDGIETAFHFQLPEPLSQALRQAEAARDESDASQARAVEATRQAIAAVDAVIPNASVRDTAALLGLSHQRVHQIKTMGAGRRHPQKRGAAAAN